MKKEIKRFDMHRPAIKPKWYIRAVEYIVAPIYNLLFNSHVTKDPAIKDLKAPFLVLATHDAFIDFPQLAYALFPHTTGWVISVDEFRRGDWLMFGIGGIPKRKFTHDIVTVKQILRYVKKLNHTCAFYPEARFSLAGVNERLDGALGKLCKHAKVPVLLFKSNGNFLNSPQWRKRPYMGIRQEGHLSILFTEKDLQELSADEVQEKIEKAFERDQYKWQVENNIHIKHKKRAENIHKILYKCPACMTEFKMDSKGTKLWCNHCGATWEMDTLSRLQGVNTDKGFSHVPDWYRWEREEVRKEVVNGTYHFEDDVRVEDYYSTRTGFIDVGNAHMTHDENGFTFEGTVDGEPFHLNKPVSSMYSLHIEYNFLKRGDAIDIATDKTTYFMFLKTAPNQLTKLHFATEELYTHYVTNQEK